jgi:NADPH-dependent 2,4-dienoyl-CoA reductase/sulfur reductase-like enzyme/nitrite reductase/ring-hydroxylating ferredoxin subunit
MGSTGQELTGPDLAAGVDVSSMQDGEMILGHVGEEAVLLSRAAGEFFATGASCTHYSGPLAEGLIVEDTIRCPWHHATFSLRTGEALRAPACAAIDVWKVEQVDGRARVFEKSAPTMRRHAPAEADAVVVVGAGAAGNSAAEQLRREGYAGRIILLTGEDEVPYDKPNLSKDYLAGKAPEEWIPLHTRDYYEDRRIDLRTGSRVVSIDRHGRSVTLDDGSSIAYGVLVLATGAEPRRLNIGGSDAPHVHYLRTLEDSRRIIKAAATAKRSVVIGASFIGLEVAASLRERGVEVVVVGPEEVPLQRVLGREVGSFIRGVHEQHGVSFRLGRTPTSITPSSVVLDDGEELPSELVVIGVGVTPATELASAAGLDVDNGIIVDEFLRTSDPNIFAAGDLARWRDVHSGESLRVEHWVVASRQGQTVARNILGRKEKFDAIPFFWSAHYDMTLSYVGHAAAWESIEISGSLEKSDATIVYRAKGRPVAVATIFRDRLSLEAELAFERGEYLKLEKLLRG